MDTPAWLLVFPPLIHSNWGSYYPSTALLAAALDEVGSTARQIDLNDRFLDHLVAPARLAELAAGTAASTSDPVGSLPIRAAANLLLHPAYSLSDARGRRLPPERSPGLELATELARAYHVDLPLPAVLDAGFATSTVARAYDAFFAASGMDDAIAATRQAIGISVPMGPQLAPALLLARRAKRLRPDLKVILGGPTLTLMADALLELLLDSAPEIDAVVRFDGEGAIQHLATQLATGCWQPEAVANVHTRGAVKAAERTAIRLRDVPGALFDADLMGHLAEPRIALQQARGCYWGACAYCDFIELHNTGRRYDGRSVNALLDEVKRVTRTYGARCFWLVTEAIPPQVAATFAERLIAEGLDIDWRSFAMVDPGFTPDVLTAMRRSGCSSLTIGLESMTSRVLRNVLKMADEGANLTFLAAVREAGLKIDINLIPDLPTTTRNEAMAGLGLLEGYADVFRTVAIFPFEATRSSAIGRDPARYGLTVAEPDSDALHPKGQAQFASNRLVCRDDGMTTDERAEVFAAYRAFARRVSIRRRAAPPAVQRGFEVASPRTLVLPHGAEIFAYDWDRDRAWRLPATAADLVGWMQSLGRPVRRGEVATFLHTATGTPAPEVPDLTEGLLSSLVAMQVVRRTEAAQP